MEPDALFRLLHAEQSRVMDLDPDDGAGAGAAYPGQRHRPRPDPAEPAPEPRAIRRTMQVDAIAARHRPGRNCRGAALLARRAGDDRTDDRARRRPASRLGAAAPGSRGRIGMAPARRLMGDEMSQL